MTENKIQSETPLEFPSLGGDAGEAATSSFEYCVAIRTVGKAGDKYIQELESLHRQTVKPKHIFVHLAEGFERPKKQVGMEEYIITPKGLVHQRAASLDGVDTEFLLILDDDVFFPEDAVERLHDEMMRQGADCISPDTFPNQEMSFAQRMIAYWANGVTRRSPDDRAIVIEPNGAFSFNPSPEKGRAYPTQSAAGPALFIKTEVFRAIRYEDEYWVDQFPAGTFYEDQLMFHKIHKNGFKVLLQYDAGVIHLDAGTNNVKQKTYEKLMYRAMAQYVIWYRSCYDADDVDEKGMRRARRAYRWRYVRGYITRCVFSLLKFSPRFIKAYIDGNREGQAFVKTSKYLTVPNFIVKHE